MKDDITVIITTSPIPSHPNTEVLETTIQSVRERLPDSEIIVCFDGVEPQLMSLKTQYDEFKQRMLRILSDMGNCVPMIFEGDKHQSLMTREALKQVRTPVILFMEHDTPLHNEIPFEQLVEPIKAGYINTLRFHFEATIPEPHTHLMLDQSPIDILGVPVIRTKQWSQRPHLASTQYYQHICDTYWDDQPRFIEHIMYGRIAEGGDNWDEHRLHIYAPEGPTFVRSKHLDGRRLGAAVYDPSPT